MGYRLGSVAHLIFQLSFPAIFPQILAALFCKPIFYGDSWSELQAKRGLRAAGDGSQTPRRARYGMYGFAALLVVLEVGTSSHRHIIPVDFKPAWEWWPVPCFIRLIRRLVFYLELFFFL
jgi:hypothetical protein